VTDAARSVAGLFLDPPPDAQWRPVLRVVARLAFGTLPAQVRAGYQLPHRAGERAVRRATFAVMRAGRPLLPAKFRYIAPYQSWRRRRRLDDPSDATLARSLGIRP
jgi:uncharacterized protein (DUF2236 family)